MSDVIDLCRPCACAIEGKEKYLCRPVKGGVDNKVRCERCGRRRYGMTYRLEETGKPERSLSALMREFYSEYLELEK